jgi:hypothetical protein
MVFDLGQYCLDHEMAVMDRQPRCIDQDHAEASPYPQVVVHASCLQSVQATSRMILNPEILSGFPSCSVDSGNLVGGQAGIHHSSHIANLLSQSLETFDLDLFLPLKFTKA